MARPLSLMLATALMLPICVSSSFSGEMKVSGSGQVAAVPDIATTIIEIRSRAKEASKAQSLNVETVKQVTQELGKLGIATSDIHTSSFQFRRDARNDADGNITELGYYAEMSLTVTVRNFDNLGKVVAVAVSNGATSINDFVFSIADTAPLVEKARTLAFENASLEASRNAAAAKVTLVGISAISDGQATLPGFGQICVACADISSPDDKKKLEPEIRPDRVAVGYDVTVAYEFK